MGLILNLISRINGKLRKAKTGRELYEQTGEGNYEVDSSKKRKYGDFIGKNRLQVLADSYIAVRGAQEDLDTLKKSRSEDEADDKVKSIKPQIDAINETAVYFNDRRIMNHLRHLEEVKEEIKSGKLEGRVAYNNFKYHIDKIDKVDSGMVSDEDRIYLADLEKSLEPESAGYEVKNVRGQRVLESRSGSRMIGGGSVE